MLMGENGHCADILGVRCVRFGALVSVRGGDGVHRERVEIRGEGIMACGWEGAEGHHPSAIPARNGQGTPDGGLGAVGLPPMFGLDAGGGLFWL